MSEENHNDECDNWSRDTPHLDSELPRSCSCFEIQDPHDPIISRLATQLFQKTDGYLQGEMIAGQDYYSLLEELNRIVITKHADLRNFAVNLSKSLLEYNEMYTNVIKPLLLQIDNFHDNVTMLEANAYRLDVYTKQLKVVYKSLQEK